MDQREERIRSVMADYAGQQMMKVMEDPDLRAKRESLLLSNRWCVLEESGERLYFAVSRSELQEQFMADVSKALKSKVWAEYMRELWKNTPESLYAIVMEMVQKLLKKEVLGASGNAKQRIDAALDTLCSLAKQNENIIARLLKKAKRDGLRAATTRKALHAAIRAEFPSLKKYAAHIKAEYQAIREVVNAVTALVPRYEENVLPAMSIMHKFINNFLREFEEECLVVAVRKTMANVYKLRRQA